MRAESKQYYEHYHEAKRDLISCFKTLDTQQTELQTLRTEYRIAEKLLEERNKDCKGLRSRLELVIKDRESMLAVREEYRVQGVQALLAKNADEIKLEN